MSNNMVDKMEILKEENQKIIFEVVNGVSREDNLLIEPIKLKQFILSKSQQLLSTNEGQGIKNLIELNKEIIKESHNYILSQQAYLRNSFSVKKSELNNEYNANLKKHQDDLNSYTKPPNENISFEDEKDEPIGNIKNILSDAMLQRERDLNMITGNYNDESSKKAMEWLNGNQSSNDISVIDDSNEGPKLEIGRLIENPVQLNIREKDNGNNNERDNERNHEIKPILLNGNAELTKQDNDKIKNLFRKLKPAKVTFKDDETSKDKLIESLRKEIEELKQTINELRKNN